MLDELDTTEKFLKNVFSHFFHASLCMNGGDREQCGRNVT